MPRRWPTVTSSTASTVPAGSPSAVDDLGRRATSSRPDRKPCAALGAADEAHVLAVGLARPCAGRAGPAWARTSSLVMSPTGNSDPGQRGLAQHGQHVGLVLGGIGAAAQA